MLLLWMFLAMDVRMLVCWIGMSGGAGWGPDRGGERGEAAREEGRRSEIILGSR